MPENTRPTVDTVHKVLKEVYGPGIMTEELSYEIVDWWGGWARAERSSENGRPLKDELYLMIWNWFPGGDTAGYAADKIMEAVGNT